MSDIFNMADTWNNVATTFNAIKMAVTDTTSAAASRLVSITSGAAGATDAFYIDKVGNVVCNKIGFIGNASPTGWTYIAAWPLTEGMVFKSYAQDMMYMNGQVSFTSFRGDAGWFIGLSGTNNIAVAADIDLRIFRDAAGVFAQRNAANTQAQRVYNTWTDASNGEWVETGFASNVPYIRAIKNGSGTQRALTLGAGAADHLKINTDGSVNVNAATATPAGGSTAARLLFGTTSGFGIYYGNGAPSSLTAAQGSIYLNSTASTTSTRLYVNTTGSTTWATFTASA